MLSVVPRPVVVRAPSKVNLHLAVGDLRDDGYHELTTVFQALSLADTLTVAPADTLTVRVIGDDAAAVPTDRTNLVWRAAEMLAVEGGVAPNVEIVIEKGIPVAGGMAGRVPTQPPLWLRSTLCGSSTSRGLISTLLRHASGVTFRSRCTVALPSEPAAANNLSPC